MTELSTTSQHHHLLQAAMYMYPVENPQPRMLHKSSTEVASNLTTPAEPPGSSRFKALRRTFFSPASVSSEPDAFQNDQWCNLNIGLRGSTSTRGAVIHGLLKERSRLQCVLEPELLLLAGSIAG